MKSSFPLSALCLGLIEVFATNYLGSVYTQIITFASVIIILVVLPNGLLGRAQYNPDMFDATTIERTLQKWQRLLEAAASSSELRVSELPL